MSASSGKAGPSAPARNGAEGPAYPDRTASDLGINQGVSHDRPNRSVILS